MKLEDLYEKLFDFEFCEPGDKAVKEQEFKVMDSEAQRCREAVTRPAGPPRKK